MIILGCFDQGFSLQHLAALWIQQPLRWQLTDASKLPLLAAFSLLEHTAKTREACCSNITNQFFARKINNSPMRYQGKITRWQDDQGFGFITPNAGGGQVFVHIKAFSNRRRRPVGNEMVTYELQADQRGRAKAANVAFVDERAVVAAPSGNGSGWLVLLLCFVCFVGFLAVSGKLPGKVLGLYLVASLLAFVFYAWDKSAAEKNHWRTKESTLHLIALAGGWPGALLAQKLLRHKSRKQSFQVVFWVTVVLNCAVLGWLLTPARALALRSLLAGVL